MINGFIDFLWVVASILIAVVRVVFLTIIMFFSGLQIALFTRTEVCNVELKGQPWRCDKQKMTEKMAYVDKLCLENPDLLEVAEELYNEENGFFPKQEDDEEDI